MTSTAKHAALGAMGVTGGFFMFRSVSRIAQKILFPKHKANLVEDFIEPERVEVAMEDTEVIDSKTYYHINVKWHYKKPDGSLDKVEWTVKKRYSDFDFLYKSFRSFDPDNRIPQPPASFPMKDYNNANLQMSTPTDEQVKARKEKLENWLLGYEDVCSTQDGVAVSEKVKLRQALAGFYNADQHVGHKTDVYKELKKAEHGAKAGWFGASAE